MDRAAGDVERLTKAEESHARASERGSRATSSSRREYDALGRTIRRVGSDADRNHGFLQRLFSIDPGKAREMDDVMKGFERTLNRNRFSVAALDNRLRGLLVLGVIGFFQQLVSVVGALGGTLASIAATAIQAGEALGGMAVAGAAQAIPVIGLLVAAWGRVGAVFKTVQQAQKQAMQAGFDHTQQMDRQANAADALKNAQDAVVQAHRRVTETTLQLTKAKRDATRQTEDLYAAEEKARIAAQSAALSEIDARRSLQQSVATGAVDDQARNELDVRSAAQQRREANRQLTRARQDAGEARRGSPLGPQGQVQQAQQAAQEAQRGVQQADRQLAQARRDAANTDKQLQGAQRTLNQMLAQLSPAERQLYESMRRLQATYKRLFRPITDIVVGGFTDAVGRITHVMGDRRVLDLFTGLAHTIRDQMGRITQELTSNRSINFFSAMGHEAERNLPIITTIGIRLFRVFQNVATAASPALHEFLKFLSDLATRADEATGTTSGMSRLQRFFDRGEKMVESILKLGGAFAHLFGAIISGGAKQGQTTIDRMTASVQRAAEWIGRHQQQVRDFFRTAAVATGAVAGVFGVLLRSLASLYNPSSAQSFARALNVSVIPALTAVTHLVSLFTNTLLDLMGTRVGGTLASIAISAGLVFKVFSPMFLMTSKLVEGFALLTRSTRGLQVAFRIAQFSTGPMGFALATIAAAILLLDQRFHILRPTIIAIAGVLTGTLVLAFSSARRAQALFLAGMAVQKILNAVDAISAVIKALGLLRVAFITTGIGAILVALGILAAAFIKNKNKTDEATESQRRFRAAIQDSRNAVQRYSSALGDLTDANLNHRASVLNLRQAEAELTRVRKDPHSTRLDVQQAQLSVDQARRDVQTSNYDVARAERAANKERDTTIHTLRRTAPEILKHGRSLRDITTLDNRAHDSTSRLGRQFSDLTKHTKTLHVR
jgi:hypothetical protein